MRGADKSLRKEQARYKRNFDARLRKPKYDIPSGSYVFLKEQGTASEPKHKLAQVAIGSYQVRSSDQHTVVIAIGDQEERVSRDRVEFAPSPMDHVPITGLRQALQFFDGTEENEGRNVIEDDDHSHVRASPQVDNDNLVGDSQTIATNPQDVQGVRGSEERDESHNLRKGEEDGPIHQEGSATAEYVIDRIVNHGFQEEKLILKVRWYGYTAENATWEPIEQLPRSAAVSCFRRKRLPLPAQVAHAKSG